MIRPGSRRKYVRRLAAVLSTQSPCLKRKETSQLLLGINMGRITHAPESAQSDHRHLRYLRGNFLSVKGPASLRSVALHGTWGIDHVPMLSPKVGKLALRRAVLRVCSFPQRF